jgi:Icc-related predicted phosphoesterase
MRILAISDEISNVLYNHHLLDVVGKVDVLIGCGDLPYDYMEYIVTATRVRHAYYVHGNHDQPLEAGNRVLESPGGWVNLDRRVAYLREYNLLIAGLEGSIRYTPKGAHQYTEHEMAWRARRLIPKLLWNRRWRGRYLDIFIAHSPPKGIHDRLSSAHRGFPVFTRLLKRFRPRLMLHGHVHRYGPSDWRTHFQNTTVINVVPYCIIDLEDDSMTCRNLHNR